MINNKRVMLGISLSLLSFYSLPFPLDNFDLLSNPDVINEIEHTDFNITRATASDEEVAQLLIDIGAATILQQDAFCGTYRLNTRNLLDYPEFLPQRSYCYDWIVGTHFFWNQMDSVRFINDCTSITSYLDIQNPDLLDELEKALDLVPESFLTFDPFDVLPLFSNMTIQERRLGMMVHAERQFSCAGIRFMFPFYYLERNFFTDEQTQFALEDTLGRASEDDAELFAKHHLISDQLGFGDARFHADARCLEWDMFCLRVGGYITLPTAFAIAKGLLGSEFFPPCKRPTIDLKRLFELGQGTRKEKAEAVLLGQEFALEALNNLSAMLLQTNLGSNHLGLAFYFQSETGLYNFIKRPWTENFIIRSRWSLEYLFPACETRFYIEQCKHLAFEELGLDQSKQVINMRIANDPLYAAVVLDFLQRQFVNEFFPFAFKTKVYPGVVFRATNKFLYESERAGFHIGSDFWLQGPEKLRNIQFTHEAGEPERFNINKATKPLAYQSKAHGSLFYKVRRDNQDWTLALNGDVSVWGSSIGDDFTLTLNIETNF